MAYVRNAWYVASWSKDVGPREPLGLMILGEPIVVWRDGEDNVHALEDRCIHRLAPLSRGRCEGANLRCMYHGLLFTPEGRLIAVPGQDVIPPLASVRSYPALDLHGWIWIWMGDPALADESLVPTVYGTDDSAWLLQTGELDYDAEARLINDNLTDFSHLSFVHTSSFGTSEAFAESQAKITPMPRGVRFERWSVSQPALGRPDAAQRFDSWMVYEFSVPGILLLMGSTYAAGTAARCDHAAPPADLPPLRNTYTAQAVTPVSEGRSRYLFSTGFDALIRPEAVQFLMDVTLAAFAEDKAMIEAQQKVIDIDPARQVMPIVADKGVTLFNRLVDRLAKRESAALSS